MKFSIKTDQKEQVLDITGQVNGLLAKASAKDGVCVVTVLHTTCAVTTAEFDPGTDKDLMDFLHSLIPDIKWRHAHDPAHTPSHLISSIIGPSVVMPVASGQLQLGTWQRVALIELDGPRKRSLEVSFLPK